MEGRKEERKEGRKRRNINGGSKQIETIQKPVFPEGMTFLLLLIRIIDDKLDGYFCFIYIFWRE